jgi:hypothetical protein
MESGTLLAYYPMHAEAKRSAAKVFAAMKQDLGVGRSRIISHFLEILKGDGVKEGEMCAVRIKD